MAAINEFMHHLSMAACELFLIFLMLLDSALAYILMKFAHHCELQPPCIFCSRLDHVFPNEKPKSYLNLFCSNHRAEVSSLVSCNLHEKLADVRELCDECFLSVCASYGSNEGKMGIKGYQKPYLNWNLVRAPSSSGTCSCCESPWKAKPSSQKLTLGIVKPPLPKVSGRPRFRKRNHHRKRSKDKLSSVNSAPCNLDKESNMDGALSDYADVRFSFDSDSDSDVSFYEYDNTAHDTTVISEKHVQNHNHNHIQDHIRDEQFHSVSDTESSLLDLDHNESLISPFSLTSPGSIDNINIDNLDNIDTTTSPDHKDESFEDVIEHEVDEEEKSLPLPLPLTRDSVQDTHMEPSSSDKNDEGYESPGVASSVSDIEGESTVDKLKRQVEYDRERLRLLRSELEEERNAAAIAADEAMAMITRLQEEKAALHMEALQYLRMMDEQAEYDMEALDKANDLVAEKDKEIQDLEAELESFRIRYENEYINGNTNNNVCQSVS